MKIFLHELMAFLIHAEQEYISAKNDWVQKWFLCLLCTIYSCRYNIKNYLGFFREFAEKKTIV